jgi:hypothetical protein
VEAKLHENLLPSKSFLKKPSRIAGECLADCGRALRRRIHRQRFFCVQPQGVISEAKRCFCFAAAAGLVSGGCPMAFVVQPAYWVRAGVFPVASLSWSPTGCQSALLLVVLCRSGAVGGREVISQVRAGGGRKPMRVKPAPRRSASAAALRFAPCPHPARSPSRFAPAPRPSPAVFVLGSACSVLFSLSRRWVVARSASRLPSAFLFLLRPSGLGRGVFLVGFLWLFLFLSALSLRRLLALVLARASCGGRRARRRAGCVRFRFRRSFARWRWPSPLVRVVLCRAVFVRCARWRLFLLPRCRRVRRRRRLVSLFLCRVRRRARSAGGVSWVRCRLPRCFRAVPCWASSLVRLFARFRSGRASCCGACPRGFCFRRCVFWLSVCCAAVFGFGLRGGRAVGLRFGGLCAGRGCVCAFGVSVCV